MNPELKKKLEEMLTTKNEARSKLIKEMAVTDDKEVRASQLELMDSLDVEIRGITDMLGIKEEELDPELQKRAKGLPEDGFNPLTQSRSKDAKKANEELEKRGADLKAGKAIKVPGIEERAATLTTEGLVVEKKYSREINPTFNEVSTLIDNVNSVPLQGGESYTKAFAVSGGEGDYTGEGADAADIEMKFDSVEIGKAKITAYAEITKEVKKLPNIAYYTYVNGEVRKAIRKKITRQIIIGAGTANTLTGIYNAPANVIPASYDFEASEINQDTLSDITFAYGGDEDVEDEAYLVLSKKDLQAFANVRNEDKKKAYKITKRGNAGTIEEVEGGVMVNYILNSACKPLSADTTAVDAYTMVYGRLGNYEMPIFSDIEIEEDSSYKFKQGMIAFRGEVYLGGNVAAYKGWMRVKKVAAVQG